MSTRIVLLAAVASLGLLAGCADTTASLQTAVPVAAVQDAQTALATYQAALGVAQVALVNDPALLAKVNAISAQAAPYIAAVQAGTTQASTAPTLAALAAQLLVDGAAYFQAIPTPIKAS